ncbi:MAG: class I SAM-dependent methyltransferase [Sphingomonas sp.]|uniref:class I SAM-dependent methyltransferase n=1 Tax=Sphingomonas sp. TaxID=28214 RepID=UPI003F80D6C8
MRVPVLLLLAAFALPAATATPAIPPVIAKAVADSSRPPEDVARDANRKPAETLAFLGVRPGMKIADYIANSGYFTRLFADVAGPKGHVYAVELNEIIGFPNVAKGYADLKAWAAGRPNVTVTTTPIAASLDFPEKLDLFWIAQNYHDLHDKFLGPADVPAFNRKVFAALKPGGLYVVLDHSAAAGAPDDVTETLHRIQEERVKREVLAAGFELVGESKLLANPADPRTKGVFDESIRGKTDQFILKFRKPRG